MFCTFFIFLAFFIGVTCSDKLIFGQSADFTGPVNDLGWALYHGIKAAFKEQNDRGGVRGTELILEAKDDGYVPENTAANINSFLSNSSIFAIAGVLGTGTSKSAVDITIPAKMPFIGAYTGGLFLRQPYNRYVVNIRPSYADEAAAMVEYLVSRGIKRISGFWINNAFGLEGRQGIFLGLRSKNLRLFSEGKYLTTSDIPQAILDIEINASIPFLEPEAIIMIGTAPGVCDFVILAKKKWPNVYLMGASPAGTKALRDCAHAKAQQQGISKWYTNVVFTQIVPPPTDNSISIVSKYQSALLKYDSKVEPGYANLEGYVVGRFIIEALFRLEGNFEKEAFLDAIYRSGNFYLHNLRCGPLLAPGMEFMGDSSGCNQCMRAIWGSRFTDQGAIVAAPETNYNFPTCGYKGNTWNHFLFALLGNPEEPFQKDYIRGIEAAFLEVNDDGGIRGSKLSLNVSNHNDDIVKSQMDTLSYVADPNILALFGMSDQMAINNAMGVGENIPMIGFIPGYDMLRDPFDRRIVNVRLSYVDEAAIMTSVLADQNIRGISVIRVDTQISNDGIKGVKIGLASIRETIRSQATLIVTSSEDQMKGNIKTALDLVESTSDNGKNLEGIILLTPESIENTVQLIIEVKKRWPDIHVIASNNFPLGESIGAQLIESARNNSVSINAITSKLYFTQVVPSSNDIHYEIVQEYHKAMDNLDRLSPRSSVSLEGYLAARLLIDLIRRTPGDVTHENILKAAYSGSQFGFKEIWMGPYKDDPNSGCNQGLDIVWLKKISKNGSLDQLWDGNYTLSSGLCNFYTPNLYDFKLSGLRSIALFASILSILAIVVVLFLLFRNKKKSSIRSGLAFSIVTGVGLILTICTNVVGYSIPNSTTCAIMPWVMHMSFAITFAPLLAKSYKIASIRSDESLKKYRIKDKDLYQIVILICAAFVIFLIMWSAITGLPETETGYLSDRTKYEKCVSTQNVVSILCLFTEVILLAWGTILSNRINDIKEEFPHFSESKAIGICIHNASVLGVLLISINVMSDLDPNLVYMVNSGIVVLNAAIAVKVLFVSKLRNQGAAKSTEGGKEAKTSK